MSEVNKTSPFGELKSIASKGGTTEAALSQLKKDKVHKRINKAIHQAYNRSKKILGK